MKDLKIPTGEPFRAKVLGYSFTHLNKVVERNTTLYPVNNYIFVYDYQKEERGDIENDIFAFFLKIENIYVETD